MVVLRVSAVFLAISSNLKLVQQKREHFGWRVAFLIGLIGAPAVWSMLMALPQSVQQIGTMGLVIGGLLVGLGTRYANGCTSGHGICGLSRFSLRKLMAVCSFMGSAIVTVFIMRHVLGGCLIDESCLSMDNSRSGRFATRPQG